MVYEVKLHNPTLSTFEVSVVQRAIKLIMEKNWALSVDQCWLQLQLLVHLIDFLSILLRCNGFTGIQKAVVDQTGRRPPNSDHEPSLGASSALRGALELLLSLATELVVACYCIKSTFHHMPQSNQEMVCCCVE